MLLLLELAQRKGNGRRVDKSLLSSSERFVNGSDRTKIKRLYWICPFIKSDLFHNSRTLFLLVKDKENIISEKIERRDTERRKLNYLRTACLLIWAKNLGGVAKLQSCLLEGIRITEIADVS